MAHVGVVPQPDVPAAATAGRPLMFLFDAGAATPGTMQWFASEAAAVRATASLPQAQAMGVLALDVVPVMPLHLRTATPLEHCTWQHAELVQQLAAHGCPGDWHGGLWIEGLGHGLYQPATWLDAQTIALAGGYGRALLKPGQHVLAPLALDALNQGLEIPRPAAAAGMLLRYVAAGTSVRNPRLQLSGVQEPAMVWVPRHSPSEALVHLLTFLDLRYRTVERDRPLLPSHLWLRVAPRQMLNVTQLYHALTALHLPTLLVAARLAGPSAPVAERIMAALDETLDALEVSIDLQSFNGLAYMYRDRACAMAVGPLLQLNLAPGAVSRALFDTHIGAPATTFYLPDLRVALMGLYADGPDTGRTVQKRPMSDPPVGWVQRSADGTGTLVQCMAVDDTSSSHSSNNSNSNSNSSSPKHSPNNHTPIH
jgi:hypothetical protein